MPGWAVPVLPIDKLEAGRKRGEIGKPRAWIGEGVILIAPQFNGCMVTAALAVTESVEGAIALRDVDSETTFTVVVPPNHEHCWMLDAEFLVQE